jgi:hypothetical protein
MRYRGVRGAVRYTMGMVSGAGGCEVMVLEQAEKCERSVRMTFKFGQAEERRMNRRRRRSARLLKGPKTVEGEYSI